MQEYKKTMIGKDQIVPIAERMRKNEVWLTMIHAFVTKEGQIEVCSKSATTIRWNRTSSPTMSWERPSCPRSAVSMT